MPLIPVLIDVKKLARLIRKWPVDAEIDERALLQYWATEFETHPEGGDWLMLISQALHMRSLVLVIDGIDAAAGRKESILKLVRDVLVCRGLRVVCTARPEAALSEDLQARFVMFALESWTNDQARSYMQLPPKGKRARGSPSTTPAPATLKRAAAIPA